MDDSSLRVRQISNSELKISLQSRNDMIWRVRRLLKDFASKQGFSEREIFEVQLAVNEAIANVIEHAYQGDQSGEIEFDAGLDANNDLVIHIKDYGRKPDEKGISHRDLDELADGGLGTFLIQNLMDEVRYEHGEEAGTLLTLKKARQDRRRTS